MPDEEPLDLIGVPITEVTFGTGSDEEPLDLIDVPITDILAKGLGTVEPPRSESESPISTPVSYSILLNDPAGELIASFEDKEGGHDSDRYDHSSFLLGPEGRGSFTFRSGTSISVEGTGTVSASEERVEFKNQIARLSGEFLFLRGHAHGVVKLQHRTVLLTARAIRGVGIDPGTELSESDQ